MTIMDRRTIVQATLLLPLLPGVAQARGAGRYRTYHVDAPFPMPAVRVPDFTGAARFSIASLGAVPGDQARTDAAMRQAILAARSAGGGTVLVPAGTWRTGPIHLESNVNLHLEDGATLLFSPNPRDYLPPVQTSWEGIECLNYSPLIYAYGCENIAITGTGRLQAELDVWREWYRRPKAHMEGLVELYQLARAASPVAQRDMTKGAANLRPHFIQFNRCRHVLIEGVSIQNSPFWTIHPYLCRDVVIRQVRITADGHNNDGVDPEMSQNVLIEDCVFDQGDDAVSVKSGREDDAWRLATPSRNIVMRNCLVKNGHQLMAIGSELSGGIENVFVNHCRVEQDAGAKSALNNLLFVKTNERRGGYVRNIYLSNVSSSAIVGGVLSVDTDVLYQWRTLVPTYQRKLTPIEGLHIENVTAASAQFRARIKGETELPVRNVTLRNIRVGTVAAEAVETVNVQGFSDR
ncbi:glycoside hydrolase family 28 protein [Novosphingobium sp.]|uniref:glycoside hydrolase family 28 protein n=1 Tax=Novosphingobium sp. TaxID=1874826 RepID=UPI0028ABF51E|nr:glycoside hydrolase family 28 protein [Novosphingobium sp.]